MAQSERVTAFIEQVARAGSAKAGDSAVVLLGHSMGGGIVALTAANHPQAVGRVGLFDAAGVRFKDNRFGEEVLAGRNPFAVTDEASLDRYLDTVFHMVPSTTDTLAASRALIAGASNRLFSNRACWTRSVAVTAFSARDAASRIDQRRCCCVAATNDRSRAIDLYCARMPQAFKVLLDDCGPPCRSWNDRTTWQHGATDD